MKDTRPWWQRKPGELGSGGISAGDDRTVILDRMYGRAFDMDARKFGARLRRLEIGERVLRRTQPVPTTATTTKVTIDNVAPGPLTIDLTKLDTVGSMPPSVNQAGFSYVATHETVTIYWDGTHDSLQLIRKRADETQYVIPKNHIYVGKLLPSTTYYAAPFWTVKPGNCNVGWVLGNSGEPRILHSYVTTRMLQEQNLSGRERLSEAPLEIVTTAIPVSPPVSTDTGTATGDPVVPPAPPPAPPADDPYEPPDRAPKCVLRGTAIKQLGNWPMRIDTFPQDQWIKVYTTRHTPLICTPDHPLFASHDGRVEAQYLQPNDLLLCDDGEDICKGIELMQFAGFKEAVHMENGHLFFANGYLSHNTKAGQFQ